YLYWDIILSTSQGIDAVKDVFIFVEDECELTIEVIDAGEDAEEKPDSKRLGEILVERGDLSPEDLGKVLRSRKLVGEMLVDAAVVEPGAVESALVEQQHLQKKREKRKDAAASSIRVAARKLDVLMDLVGELVTVQARLSQKAVSQADPEMLAISEEVEHLTAELRDNTMSIRMIPIGATFSRFRRLVRDLSGELGKNIVLLTEGAETELDKTVIDRLNDPLVHIIRNSIDHGVETPGIRTAAGKPEQGVIQLSAEHAGASVLIRVSDDGAGLDKKGILEKAKSKGLVTPEEAAKLMESGGEASDKEIFSLIFAPGFSMAEKVTDVSGRGVGMDVVKRGIEALGGVIDISSERGKGAVITLRLPLTLAIIDGLLVRIGSDDYVFPLSAVEECVELTREEAERARKRGMMDLRGHMVSFLSLREFLEVDGEPPEFEMIVIVEANGRKIGFAVDVVIGQHQTVIKTIGDIYKDVKCVSGATIEGDGSVALILDVNMLIQSSGRSGPRAERETPGAG
ncbi:MAG: chemotaxis protein CheA, partial [Desulfobacterales bacterium]|nr:chemotaxis protein CheA [Desulfobacterales bacterium]